jgi:hypothetical protein
VATIIIAIVLSVLTLSFYQHLAIDAPDISPIPENPDDPGGIAQGAIFNMLFYVILAFIGGVIVLIIMKKGLGQLLVYFFAAAMGFSWFIFGLFYGSIVVFEVVNLLFWDFFPAIWEFFQFSENFIVSLQIQIQRFFDWNIIIGSQQVFVVEALIYIFALLLGLLGIISFGIQTFDRIWIRNMMMILFGAMIGSMLAIHLGLLTTILILIGLSIYDIYAVFRGPLKGIIDHSRETANEFEEQLKEYDEQYIEYKKVPLLPALPVYSSPLINIGLGDFAFFSMLISATVVISDSLYNPIPLIAGLIGLFLGVFYTFKFLEEERALPGLPLPIFGGLGFLTVSIIGGLIFGFFNLESVFALFA